MEDLFEGAYEFMDISKVITKELGLKEWQTDAVIQLIDEGNTIPFIARYRKEAHGAMNDEQLRAFDERLKYLRSLEERKTSVLGSIEEQGKLTEELRKSIDNALTMTEVEDLYRPYKKKRRTRAMIAREKGLEPLAEYILNSDASHSVEKEAEKYVSEEEEVPDAAAAIQMAEDIIAEQISDSAEYRSHIRKMTEQEGLLHSEKKASKAQNVKKTKSSDQAAPEDENGKTASSKRKNAGKEVQNKKLAARAGVYDNYYDYSEPVRSIPGHRILALNRGEKEGFLSVKLEVPEEKMVQWIVTQLESVEEQPKKVKKEVHSFADLAALRKQTSRRSVNVNKWTDPYIREAAKDAYKRLIQPSIETEVRNELTEKAEDGAMKVFAENLRQLLMQPPITGKVVLGWDPAFRTGCKLAVVDETGKVLDTKVIFPTEPQNKVKEAKEELLKLCKKYHVDLISCGNGTASRESEQVIADFIKESGLPIHYAIVNEAGASVYSASKLATEEFPNFDVGQRSAASIARRLQDPLAELVKIDPKSIGVGQYQHDMNQAKLGESLTAVVEDCVNHVGVDANTASAALLGYISGISRTVAKNIVSYREEHGKFSNRKELLKVKGLGPKAFEQCAGFLRIRDGEEPLDMTAVHPESYEAARKLLRELGYTQEDVKNGGTADIEKRVSETGRGAGRQSAQKKLAEETGLGEYTLADIIAELAKPGRDPREDAPAPVLRQDVLSIDDLKEGMILTGTVRNIVDFGAFVDIGVHQDGLVHISQLADRYVKHPLDVVKVGDVVKVKVLGVDKAKNRISLSMRGL